MTYTHPNQLPAEWFELWQERASIVQEGCRLPTDIEGTREANRRAFAMILREMEAERCANIAKKS